ncbi:MAG: OmpA family protein [Bacteroidota bacterium]
MKFLSSILLAHLLILVPSALVAQLKKAKDRYPNGTLKFKGRYIECVTADSVVHGLINHEKRKVGKWTAYYSNGHVKEERTYTSGVKNCKAQIFKEGTWHYYNAAGLHYLTETYHHDTLLLSEIDISHQESVIGKLMKSDKKPDSIVLNHELDQNNYIPNADFEMYYYKPIQLTANGQQSIDKEIPFWHSPDEGTPDYYQKYRSVEGIPVLDIHEDNAVTGLMLYLNPNKNDHSLKINNVNDRDYKESLQVKLSKPLKKGNTYCFKGQIRLSELAGYAIDEVSLLLTENQLSFSVFDQGIKPTKSFNKLISSTNQWEEMCSKIDVSETKHYLTIGRFRSKDNLTIKKVPPQIRSSLDVNHAAYYFLDNLELYQIQSDENCRCEWSAIIANTGTDSSVSYKPEISYTLNSIQFDFDKSAIKPEFHEELNQLIDLLKENQSWHIKIKGHTDDTGDAEYNMALSEKRAQAIANWIISSGIMANRVTAIGFGNQSPVSITDQAKNRRVEVEFTRNTDH